MAAELIPLEQALEHLLSKAAPLDETETVLISDTLGRVLASDLTVPVDVPPADKSAVDGYALCCADLGSDATLAVSARITAGQQPAPLEPGTAARIFTGASIPAGADAVIMQENVDTTPEGIRATNEIAPAQNITRQGQDLAAGSLALARGARIRPQEMGLIASLGLDRVLAFRKLRVAVLTTGDELVEPGQPLQPGHLRCRRSDRAHRGHVPGGDRRLLRRRRRRRHPALCRSVPGVSGSALRHADRAGRRRRHHQRDRGARLRGHS